MRNPLLILAAALPLVAQGPGLPLPEAPVVVGPDGQQPQRTAVERRYRGSYLESVSRDLFTACDENADDRLDVFEASDAFEAVRGPRDHTGFAALDTDRDGFVSWPEFDAQFRIGIDRGRTFKVATCRPFLLPSAPPAPLTPLQQFLQLYDADGDRALAPAEIEQLIQRTKLPPEVAAPLMGLDRNGSGRIEEAELAPWFERLPIGNLLNGASGPLPAPWHEFDGDEDGLLDAGELRRLLLRIDPMLAHWADTLLARLDADKNGKLSLAELSPPAGPQTNGSKTKSPPTPQR